jgi:hypothetical protein
MNAVNSLYALMKELHKRKGSGLELLFAYIIAVQLHTPQSLSTDPNAWDLLRDDRLP